MIYTPKKKETRNIIKSKHQVYNPTIISRWDRFFYRRKQKKIYKKLVDNFDINYFDLIHAHTLFTDGNLAKVLSEEFNIPYIVTIRSTDLYFFKYRKSLKRNGVQILREADKVIFLAPSYKKSIIYKYIPKKYQSEILSKSHIIPNGIDDFWFKNTSAKREKSLQNEINIIYAGRIEKNKNLITTAKSLNYLNKKEGNKYKYIVAGQIKDKIEFNKLKKFGFIEFEGNVDKERLRSLFNSSDLYVMPSFFETFGLSYAEAMSQGLPVIYTQNQGFDGQFKNGEVGFSVNPNNYKEIAEKISWSMEDYNRLSNNAYSGSKNFEWRVVGQDYLNLYNCVKHSEEELQR